MKSPIWLAILCIACVENRSAWGAEQLTFRGSFAPIKVESGDEGRKAFELQVIETGEGEEQRSAWALSESGRGAWPWTERFGFQDQAASLMYERTDGRSSVPLPSPRFGSEPFAKDTQRKVGNLTYSVIDEDRAAGVDVWQVVGSNDYGPQRTLWLAKDSPLIVAFEQKVFVGQGTECRLRWELVERKKLDDADAAKLLDGFQQLTELRQQAQWQPQSHELKWNAEQRALLRDELPKLAKTFTAGPLVAVLAAANQDAQTQASRSDALAAIKAKALGKAVNDFELAGISGEALAGKDLPKQVTVLHFWNYRDAPLEEPYGQVGYLDFLARRVGKDNVKVYGVVVDERLDDRSTRAQAIASARKVKAFMNLSYGLLLDESGLIGKIGDPRTSGAKLPLWVVIGKDGKVAHYHAGFYDVQRDQGLAELEAAIKQAAQAKN